MATRNAVSTIRGYFYQFDYSILQVLRLERDTDTICVEGIEDVDINDEKNIVLHQCKCYEGTEYNHSEIKEAIEWMLKHFAENKDSDFKYYLYGVYKSGQDKLPASIDVEFAKENFFTTKHRKAPDDLLHKKLKLSDNEILNFLQKLTININAVDFEEQERLVRNELCSWLGCENKEVEPYYCNALSIIRNLATKKNASERKISREQFIQEIKNVDNQFEVWLLNKNGVDKFAKAIKNKYFNNGLNISPYDRFFVIECNKSTSIVELKTTVRCISDKYSKLTQRAKPKFCPYFCFYGLDDVKLLELKKCLAGDRITFTDGYGFRGADFNAYLVVKEPSKDNPISLRIIDSIDLLDATYEATNSTIEIYQFYNSKIYYENTKYKHIKIPFKSINDIANMV